MKRIIAAICLLSFWSSLFAQTASVTAAGRTLATTDVSRLLNRANTTVTSPTSSAADAKMPLQERTITDDDGADADSLLLIADPQLAMSSPDYQVTAGDVYTLAFAAGTTPVTYTIPVDTSYRIRVANLGVLNCKGWTYNQLKSQVDSLVSKNYPMGGVQFVLTSPAVFLVSITGEVRQAVEKKAWALTRLSTFVSTSLTYYSSVRTVSVISMDGEKKDFDLFKAQRDGDFEQDPYLRPGDKIVINRYERKIAITGEVERPGTYEILTGENLQDLVQKYGGGLTPFADTSRIELYRISGQKDSGEVQYLSQKDIDANLPLLCYDEIDIGSYEDLQSAMFLQGAVDVGIVDDAEQTTKKLTVRFYEGKNYATLIRENSDVFSASSDLEHAYIIRGEQQIPIDLAKILYDSSYYSTETAQNGDTLLVPFKLFFVTVSGAVTNPGRFPYIPDRDWKYYVGLAGGIDTSRNSREKMDIMASDGSNLSKSEFIPPEATIDVKENSLWYKWNKVAPTVTTLLTIISTTLSIIVVSQSLSK